MNRNSLHLSLGQLPQKVSCVTARAANRAAISMSPKTSSDDPLAGNQYVSSWSSLPGEARVTKSQPASNKCTAAEHKCLSNSLIRSGKLKAVWSRPAGAAACPPSARRPPARPRWPGFRASGGPGSQPARVQGPTIRLGPGIRLGRLLIYPIGIIINIMIIDNIISY